MANAFSKEERVAFEDLLEKFDDNMVMSKAVRKYETDQVMMERANDTIWRPQPYIAQSYSGSDATSNFGDNTQMAVPSAINTQRHSTLNLNARELRDLLQERRFGEAAAQKLASDVNVSILTAASNLGSLVVPIAAAASGFDDVAQADAIMNEQGVMGYDRKLFLSTRDYNGMANNLSQISRSFGNTKSDNAYERAYVGPVAGFDTFKMDYANRIAAAGGGALLTIDTQAAANNYYTPRATSTAVTGEVQNVDNRFQTITITSTVGVAAGDAFTVGGVEAVHHITKNSTGELKTFRVVSVVDGTDLVITPPIISNQGSTDAEAQYQNVVVTPNATAPIVFLNANAANINPFWQKDCLEILPGRLAVPTDAGAAVMRAVSANGLEIVMQKQFDINTQKTKYRWDVLYGVVNLNPEMSGIMIFGQ